MKNTSEGSVKMNSDENIVKKDSPKNDCQPEIVTLYIHLNDVDFEVFSMDEDYPPMRDGSNDISFGGDGDDFFIETNVNANLPLDPYYRNYNIDLIFNQNEEFEEDSLVRCGDLTELVGEILFEQQMFDEFLPGVAQTNGTLDNLSSKLRKVLGYFTTDRRSHRDGITLQVNQELEDDCLVRCRELDELDREILLDQQILTEILPGVAQTNETLDKLSHQQRKVLEYFTTDRRNHKYGLRSFYINLNVNCDENIDQTEDLSALELNGGVDTRDNLREEMGSYIRVL